MRRNKGFGTKRRSKAPIIILVIVLVAAVAFGLAWFWQNTQEKLREPVAEPSPVVEPSKEESTVSTAPEPVEQEPTAEETNAETSTEEEPAVGAPGREEITYVVKKNESPVGNDYFADAIFFGDSISTGIPPYLEEMAEVPVIALQGINPVNAVTVEREFIPGEGNQTMLKAAERYGSRNKVYILLGGNGLGSDLESFINGYTAFVEAVKVQYPKATIYLQGMTPVTADATQTYPNLGTGDVNGKIYEYNLAIMEMAKAQGVQYLDIASVFVNENGQLPQEASPSDGMHFGAEYYNKWLDYLKTHTA